ncbi:exportin-T-like [Mya arenaria]|uniref:exportin-T-like n=1 Tax=Mya arenaria TaxID=6604 RepID=UPI0022E970E8|nr:exportin-T-like [Mya arenaria]
MDEQALRGLASMASSQEQSRALEYFEHLKSSENGWKLCAQALTTSQGYWDDYVKFFCLQVIEAYLKDRYRKCSNGDCELVRSLVASLLEIQGTKPDKNFVKNKVSQIVSLVFVADYPHRWASFFTDLLGTLVLGPAATDMFLRVLLQIDSEVVDRDIVHTQEETERNTAIKDAMREQAVQQLTDAWYQILTQYEGSDTAVVCSCLEVVGKYISWIDIGLIANEQFVPVIIRFLSNALLRESACDCISEIVSKGMEPRAKTKLVESFTHVLEESGHFNLPQDVDVDFLAKMSRMINCMGVQLISCWQKMCKVDAEMAAVSLQAAENKVPLLLRFLGDEDDDVSAAVATFTTDYISLLKQLQTLSQKQKDNVEALLFIVINKMKFDECYNFEQEGEEEAMFQEYRKQLKTIFTNLASLDIGMVEGSVQRLVGDTLTNWKARPLADIEVAIHLLYIMGEALPAPLSQHFSTSHEKASSLQALMRLLVSSGVSCHGHMMVMVHFFETVVRYEKFFQCEPQHIPHVLGAFLDERGFHHVSGQVRSRASYLFSRFIKSCRLQLQGYIEEILGQFGDLLTVNSPENGCQHLLSSDDQLFVYETAGSLIVSSNFPPQRKGELMRQVVGPIAAKFSTLMEGMVAETDEGRQLAYANSINNAISLASRASKAFSNQQTMQQCGCEGVFLELLQMFVQAVTVPVHRGLVQAGVRQYLHRMVVCMESEILPYVPAVLENLLKQPDAKELHDFLPLMNQLIMKFKGAIAPFLQEVFMPVVRTIFAVLCQPADERDQVASMERLLLQRGYYQFLATIVTNDVLDVLKHQDASNLEHVLMTIVRGATDMPDPSSQKTCFNILKRLVEAWGGEEGLPGFVDFVYKNIVPACFLAPLKPDFDMRDGQSALAVSEMAACLRCVKESRGGEFVEYLRGEYLATLNLSLDLRQQFCDALSLDNKQFKSYFKTFMMKAKS